MGLSPAEWIFGGLGILRDEYATAQASAANELRYNQMLANLGFDPGTGQFTEGAPATRSLEAQQAALQQWGADSTTLLGDYGAMQGMAGNLYRRFGQQTGSGYGGLASSASDLGLDMISQQGLGYTNLSGNVASQYATTLGGLRQGYGDLAQGYRQAGGYIDKMGVQQMADVRESYAQQQAAAQQDLAMRGMEGTGLSAASRRGTTREMSADLRRVQEGLLGQRLSWEQQALGAQERGIGNIAQQQNLATSQYAAIGQAGLGAQERGYSQRMMNILGAQQAGLGAQQQIGFAGIGTQLGAREQALAQRQQYLASRLMGQQGLADMDYSRIMDINKIIGGRVDVANISGGWENMANMFAAANAPTPADQSGAMWGSAGLGAAGAVASAKIMFACVNSEAMVSTSDGEKPLREVEIGDLVKTPSGEYVKVINKDHGRSHDKRKDDFITITAGKKSITLTKDHPISEIKSGLLKVGDRVAVDGELAKVTKIEKAAMVNSGDLKLEGGNRYIANGFEVTSMFDVLGIGGKR